MAATNKKFRIRGGDQVVVITGKDKGQVGRVLRVIPEDDAVVVEGVRVVTRHQKPAGERPGGRLTKEAPIHISNVALWNSEESRRVKVAFKVQDDGIKVRVDRKSGATIDS